MRHNFPMHPLWMTLSLLAQSPGHAVQPPPTQLEQCIELNGNHQALDEHVSQCDGRYYLDGELTGVGTKDDLQRWQSQRSEIAKHRFHSGEGFGKVKWGSSANEVKRAYPKAKGGKGTLELREDVDGLPATVRFVFVDSQLAEAQVQFDPPKGSKDVSDTMDEVKGKLETKLGPSQDGKWETPASRIDLTFSNAGEAVAVRVDYQSRELAFLGGSPSAALQPQPNAPPDASSDSDVGEIGGPSPAHVQRL
jgi:hypothetical protein